MVQNYCFILPQTERVCKYIDFFSNMQVFLLNSSRILYFETNSRVRDWKGCKDYKVIKDSKVIKDYKVIKVSKDCKDDVRNTANR